MFSYDSFFGQDHPRLHLDGSKPPLPGLRNGLQHERKQLDIFRSNLILFLSELGLVAISCQSLGSVSAGEPAQLILSAATV